MWRGNARMTTEELPCLTAGTVDQKPSISVGLRTAALLLN
jgi:hypothetical protein